MQQNRFPPPGHSQSGNALFLILIAVALFAALSYAITTSSRGGGSIEKETAVLLAAQITQQGSAMRNTVTRMVLTGTPSDLVATAPSTFFAYSPHPNQADWDVAYGIFGTDPSNELFNPAGGGALFPAAPSGACLNANCTSLGDGWFFVSTPVDGIGTGDPEIVALLAPIRDTVCNAINRGLGLSTPAAAEADVMDGIAAYPGEAAACIDAGWWLVYYHVLLER